TEISYTEENRRSARATKGQTAKTDSTKPPSDSKKKSKSGKKAVVVVQEEPAEIIRCVCGAVETGDDDKDPWIACDSCDAWQHNICMGISSYGEDVPDQYFCEQCRPQDHKELLAGIKRGQKLWEERRKIYEQEQAESQIEEPSTKKRGKKKVKKPNEPNPDTTVNGKAASATPTTVEKKLVSKNNNAKRKIRDEVQDNEDAKESQAKIRKLSTTQKPRQDSPISGLPDKIDEIDPSRQGAAKVLLKSLLHTIPQAMKLGIYTLGSNDTLEAKAERLAIAVENAVQVAYPDKAAYAKQSRAIASNLKHNLELSEGLLTRSLSPQALAAMSTDDMASKELKREKEEMKARADKQSIMVTEDGPRVRRTHKGEELVEGDSFADSNDSSMPKPRKRSTIDPNSETNWHSRENSPANQIESPTNNAERKSHDEVRGQKLPKQSLEIQALDSPPARKASGQQNFDINKVFNSVQTPTSSKHRHAANNVALPVNGPGEDPEVDKLLQDDGIESPPYSPAEYDSDPTIIWRGTVTMDSVAEFPAIARHIGGVDITQSMTSIQWSDVLAKDLKIAGRIDYEKANEYLCSLRYSPPTDLVVVKLSSTNDIHDQAFTDLYDYFQHRTRYGVLTNKGVGNIRDTYLVPVPPTPGKLPDFIINLEGHQIPEQRAEPMIVIALVIRNEWQPGPDSQLYQRGNDSNPDSRSSVPRQHRSASVTGSGPQMSPLGPPPAAQVSSQNFRPDDVQREIDQRQGEEAAKRILGDHVKAPTVAFLMPQAYQMREVEWNVIGEILREDERARDDLQHLSVVLEQRMAGRG
ncbi:BgTH12-06244, partial [Blumeria graminis f. sp. triticale]